MVNDYSDGKDSILDEMNKYMISFTQKEAGFESSIKETILKVDAPESIYSLCNKLIRDLVVEGKDDVILADTGVKLMQKLHQMYSGTVKFESGNSMVLDTFKAQYIYDNFCSNKIGIFYKFKEELNALKKVYGDNLCTDLTTFESTDKSIALQIVSGRECISLRKAKYLVYYNIDFSATSYWQSRDRMTTKDRPENDIFWVFTSKGIEFSIGSDIIDTDDLKVDASYNVSINRTEIDELALEQDIRVGGIGGGTGGTVQLHSQGYAPFSYYVYKQLYDVNGAAIEGAYADLNQDGIINDTDRYIYKKSDADVIMGFQSNVNYKDFDFSFNLRASIGNYMYNNVNSSRAQYDNLQDVTALGNLPVSVLETGFNTTSDVIISDLYIENASFLKMDNVTLGYTFNGFNNHDSSSIRLWTGVQNVFTITNYSGLDPEVFGGIDNTIYPRPRTFLVGANIKF